MVLFALMGSGAQALQVLGHAVRECREVGDEVCVGDDVEVQLASVRQCAYLHGNVARQLSPTNFTDAGSKFDAFAMRTQVAF